MDAILITYEVYLIDWRIQMAMPTSAPVQKITYGAATGALVTLVVLILNAYFLPPEKKISAEISGAATTVLTFVVAYLVPPGANETTVQDTSGATKSATKG